MTHRLVRFDWALKKLLRNKANFEILEGFFSELLHRDIRIAHILESESNKQSADDKYNRVDLLAEADGGELLLIELQVEGQYDYFHRMLYGVSKLITDHMAAGFEYHQVRKVISINIVYFDLGQGEDYVYKGNTEFKGIHKNDLLRLSSTQKKNLPELALVADIYPEYYILKFSARGLRKAAEELDIMKLPEEERDSYERYLEDRRSAESSIKTSWLEGHEKGIEKGIEQGVAQRTIELARTMKGKGYSVEEIMAITGLSRDEVE
jgi:predicted transposase/invertase (TIGR01784 family)